MQRVLFVIETLFPLGAAQQAIPLAIDLANRGNSVDIAVISGETPAPDSSTEPLPFRLPGSITVHHLGQKRGWRRNWRELATTAMRLRQTFRTVQPEIVHAWCWQTAGITLAANRAVAGHRSRRLFLTELWRQTNRQVLLPWILKRTGEDFEKCFISHPDIRLCFQKNERGKKNELIPSKICGDIFVTGQTETLDAIREKSRGALLERLNLNPDARLIGTVAPLSHRTRLKDLIWALELLNCVHPGSHLLIFGVGEQQAGLQEFARCTDFADGHIHFLGEPPNSAELIQGLEFYWHSHLLEPTPAGLLAAMHCGIPCISVYGPGTQELIHHQETGFAVNFGARDEFARWTKYLIEQKDSGQQLARQGKAFVRQNFSGLQTDRYLEFYDR